MINRSWIEQTTVCVCARLLRATSLCLRPYQGLHEIRHPVRDVEVGRTELCPVVTSPQGEFQTVVLPQVETLVVVALLCQVAHQQPRALLARCIVH